MTQHNRQSSQWEIGESSTKKRARSRTARTLLCAAISPSHVPTRALVLPKGTDCSKCGSSKFAFETPNFCCSNGSIHIVRNETPPELIKLFTANDENATHFRIYARIYNNLFAFSSLGGSYRADKKKGIYVYKVHGQIYHYISDLLPNNNPPKYLQLYFYDAAHEKENRLGLFPELRNEIIAILMRVMEQNPYALFFRSLREFDVMEDTKICIYQNPTADQRVHNAPSSEEVAAILLDGSNSDENSSPHITVFGKSNESHRVKHYYGCYDPLQYPLLFPQGESGWHQGMKKRSKSGRTRYCNPTFPISSALVQTVDDLISEEDQVATRMGRKSENQLSCREYYAYKLQIRPGNYILRSGRLFQQYIDEMYVKIENTRLDYFRYNQSTIRSELYQGIVDSLSVGETNASDVGRRVILPPSFVGGPRDIKRRYLNAMTLVQKFGKPDLFLTITCNPNWPEIKAQLAAEERPEHRPDVTTRIFRAKLVMLKAELVKKKVFGSVAARIHVVEFQKRGLPHAHFLIILKPEHKIVTPEDFDKYVCAEIPSCENPHLRRVVLRHMIHGPCGDEYPECPCMKTTGLRKKCRFRYPKKFAEFTTCGEDSYPIYRRRNTGETIHIRGAKVDNRWVTPYNPYLLALFDCHINVEICSTIKAVKYLYKYVYKGHDRVNVNIVRDAISNEDEIQSYQSARWISPPEAAWRIFGFELYDIDPPVLPLQIHLPNMQLITFENNENLETVAADDHRSKTMLTEFFRTNKGNRAGDKYLYSEFPEHYVWDYSSKTWNLRKQRGSIGRLTYASPSEGQRYYLRLLLLHIRGPSSFIDLLSVNGHTCATFEEAAKKKGLLEEDGYAESCMEEAIQVQLPCTLRRLFATLLIFCEVASPRSLWEKYNTHLSEDFRFQYKSDDVKASQLTSIEVERYLEGMGKSLKDYKLEHLLNFQNDALRITRDITDALNAPIPAIYVNASKQLNVQQRAAYKCIMQHIKGNKGGAFFIDGPGGSGKTFLYCALYAKVRSMGKIVIPTATSGIAASNIPTGRTAHSRFKIPIDDDNALTCNVSKQSSLAQLLKETTLFIWDEASMAKKENIESVDVLLQDICDNKHFFGGKVVVFGGDFRQVLPVLPHKTQQEAINSSLVCSYIWPLLIKFKLTENMRAKDDLEFSNFLLQLGNGALQSEGHSVIYLPTDVITCFDIDNNSFDLLVNMIFPEIKVYPTSGRTFNERAILAPKNEDVDYINDAIIQKFAGAPVVYKSFDTVIDDQCNTYPIEFLNSLCPSGMSPHNLILKENCPVILLRNMDPANGLCNGTRLICKKFFKNLIQCEITTGYYSGENVFLPRITLRPPSTTKYPFQFQRKQFPIKLCFAMTINKAQGQTLDQVAIYLRQQCFSHGQLYVALSRAKKRSQLKVFRRALTDSPYDTQSVKNVVSFEILKKAEIL